MPSTVYKGDLTEISFGHESGLTLKSDYDNNGSLGSGLRFHFKIQAESESEDTTTIRLQKGATDTPVEGGVIVYPLGMLVGSELVFSGLAGNFNSRDNFSEDGRRYTIVSDARGADYTDLKITPKMLSAQADTCTTVDTTNGTIHIMPFKTPTLDVDSVYHANANASSESVLTDQFAGLINTISLPETKVDLKRMHVVGLGRDVAVQVPGRFTNVGGAFETAMHNARWLYYALGQEAVRLDDPPPTTTYSIAGAVNVGANFIQYGGSTSAPTLPSGDTVAAGDYVFINDTDTVALHLHKDVGSSPVTYGSSTSIGPEDLVTQARKYEVRRIAAIRHNGSTGTHYIWLDGPLDFSHADNTTIGFAAYDSATTKAPIMSTAESTFGTITDPVNRVLFSKSEVPSFALEVSVRRRDNQDDDGTTGETVDGGASDAKQLTRVFRGCKVKEFSMTADTDAAVKLNLGFDAALCYTDTGRLESSNKGDRYNPHRIFEDVANTELARRIAGIGKRTQKPFMFYNGIIQLGGVTLGQVVSFDLKGKTGVAQHYTISGNNIANAATDQIPFGGARNASLAIEGKTEYELDMEIIVDDPTLYHQMRRAVESFDDTTKFVRLSFTKQGAEASSGRESMDIVMDDYFITEAPLPIPDDKGPLRSKLKIMPKTLRVFTQDTVFHY
jgi:hypothetical protein|tara:strand:- start:2830 stop:4845 length:2016 start_codon:yes stop_codon:yes gene_type:complete